jgi:ABC-2 type transport system permease protein
MTTYVSAFPTPESRTALVGTLEGNAAFEALFGLIRNIDTVAGYTAYKTMLTLVLLAATWGLLSATRLLRGEEDTGRWELLLAGRTTRAGATAQVLAGMGVGLVALWIPTAAVAVAAGSGARVEIGPGAALFYATALTGVAAMFMAVGAMTSQLAPTRHDANLMSAGVLAVAYLVRMAADSDPGLGWLRWASPLGWVEELHPLTGSDGLAFLPLVGLVAAGAAATLWLAARRDLGASALPGRDTAPAHTFLLGGQAGLTVRLTRWSIGAWVAVLAVTGLVFGLVTQAAGRSLQGSPTIERVIARLGATGAGAVVYLGYVFLIAAGLVAVAVAGQVAALRNEEAAGRLENLLVRPVVRWQWLGVRLALSLGLVMLASVGTGVAAWLGASSQGSGVGFVDLLRAGINIAPPAVFVLGMGVLAFGLWPRRAVALTYGLLVWSFVIEVFASVSDSLGWLRNTSPLLHIAPVPAAAANLGAAAWLVGLGLAAALAGTLAFVRRDTAGA